MGYTGHFNLLLVGSFLPRISVYSLEYECDIVLQGELEGHSHSVTALSLL